MGEPNRALIAAKLPLAATIAWARAGTEQPVHGRLVEGEVAVEHPWAWRSRMSPPRSHPGAQVSW